MAKIIITIESNYPDAGAMHETDWVDALAAGQLILDGDTLVSVVDEHGKNLIEQQPATRHVDAATATGMYDRSDG